MQEVPGSWLWSGSALAILANMGVKQLMEDISLCLYKSLFLIKINKPLKTYHLWRLHLYGLIYRWFSTGVHFLPPSTSGSSISDFRFWWHKNIKSPTLGIKENMSERRKISYRMSMIFITINTCKFKRIQFNWN